MSDQASLAATAEEAVTGIAWRPDRATLERSVLRRLIDRTGTGSFQGLLGRIAADPAWYWREALDDLDLAWQREPDRIWDLARGPAWPRWFPGGAFNCAESCTDRLVARGEEDRVAVIAEADEARRAV